MFTFSSNNISKSIESLDTRYTMLSRLFVLLLEILHSSVSLVPRLSQSTSRTALRHAPSAVLQSKRDESK